MKNNIYEVKINSKRDLKQLKKIINKCDSENLKVKFITSVDDEEIKNVEKAINIKNIEKRYSFIYDKICDYLDSKYFGLNLCGFDENGVCEYYRKIDPTHYNGCCYRKDRGLCEYFDEKNSVCTERGISCKLYSCPVLRKKKINYRINDFMLIKYFFNTKQKYYIKYSLLKPKSYVMYKLMENIKNDK